LRTEQNWIGGSDYDPCSASFVPPPPDEVANLIEDLCVFCNQDSLPAVAQAAIAHAQFETIHPFIDGNGRTGRAPVLSVAGAADLIGRSFQPTNEAIARLVDGQVLRRVTVGRRNRAFEADDVIDAFTDLERQLASPAAGTNAVPPVRTVPRRR
jgi:Fic/DOC family protein